MRALLAPVVLVALAAAPAAAQLVEVPRKLPRQWVVDDAKLLAVHEVTDLEHRLDSLGRRANARFVIVTLATLGSEPARQFVGRATSAWKPGARSVFIVVVNGRTGLEVHVEPSAELAGVLPGHVVEEVARDRIQPRLRATDRKGALRAGVEGLVVALEERAKAPPRSVPVDRSLPLPPLAPIATETAAVASTSGGALGDLERSWPLAVGAVAVLALAILVRRRTTRA